MDNMPWYDIFLESFPEAIVFLSIGFALIGFRLRENTKNIILVALTFSFLSYFIRYLPLPFGIHFFIQIFVLIVLVMFFLKLKLKNSCLVIILGSLILIIFEMINVTIFTKITGIASSKITSDPMLRTFVPYIHLFVISLIIIYLRQKNITIIPLLYNLKSIKFKANFILTLLILFLSLLIIILYSLIYTYRFRFNLLSDDKGIMLLNSVMFILLIITAITIRKVIAINETQAVLETQEMYLNNLNNLHSGLKSQRHDFINHVQVINGLLKLNRYLEATEYSDELCQNILGLSNVAQINNPVIAALIQSKIGLAENNEIKFTVNLKTDFEHIPMTSLELAGIMANLLDNAFDATSTLPVENRSVKISAEYDLKFYYIKVSNTGLPIPKTMLKAIFNSGVSGKEKHTGLGLSIIKRLVEKYKGTIDVKSDESGTKFTIIIPDKVRTKGPSKI